MAAAANLVDAASTSYDLVSKKWLDGPGPNSFILAIQTFNAALRVIFPDDGTMPLRTVSNWLVDGTSIQAQIEAADPAVASFNVANECCQYVYQLCWAAENARTAVPVRISAAQAAAVLAAFNAAW